MKNKLTRTITRLVSEQIRGVISIYQFDEYFYVEIIDNSNFVWRTEIEDVRIKEAFYFVKVNSIASAIIMRYRKYINNRYFY